MTPDNSMNLARALATAGFWILCVTGCSEPMPPPVDVQFLASDFHFTIGGHHVVTPAVAIGLPSHTFDLRGHQPETSLKDRLRSEASDPNHPMRADKLDLAIRQYQYVGGDPGTPKICALLTRKWSQSVCRGTHGGVLQRLPERFQLLDRNKLDLLQYHWTVGRERTYDQVKDMALRPGITETGCDRQSKFCTAALDVLPGLLAVWTVWSDEKTGVTAQAMADAQGAAIVQFVRRALGPVEDPTLIDAS